MIKAGDRLQSVDKVNTCVVQWVTDRYVIAKEEGTGELVVIDQQGALYHLHDSHQRHWDTIPLVKQPPVLKPNTCGTCRLLEDHKCPLPQCLQELVQKSGQGCKDWQDRDVHLCRNCQFFRDPDECQKRCFFVNSMDGCCTGWQKHQEGHRTCGNCGSFYIPGACRRGSFPTCGVCEEWTKRETK